MYFCFPGCKWSWYTVNALCFCPHPHFMLSLVLFLSSYYFLLSWSDFLSYLAVSSYILLHFAANIDPTRRYLYLQVLGGKAFLEHLQEPEPLPGQICSTFTLCLHFRNQRFRSKPVPCACEPDFHDGFLLEVHRENLGKEQ